MQHLPSAGLRLMAVHAHPDDEASKGAAVTARYADEGARVMVVTCTGGERGDIHNPALVGDESVLANLTAIRRDEMAAAAKILGVEHAWLGFVDSGYPEGVGTPEQAPLPPDCFAVQDVSVAAAALVALIREFRPHVITTYDENGGYPHPDHIMCHNVSMAAYHAAGRADQYPEAGEPWQPIKAYYNGTFSRARMTAFHEALLAAGADSPFAEWLERSEGRPDRPVHAQVQCAAYYHLRDLALKAHATQIDPDGFFFAVTPEVVAEVWPTEEYELGHSFIPTATMEDDLFAGIRDTDLVETGAAHLVQDPVQ